jgi:hypothetical protein
MELPACSSGICHFRHMLEGQPFTIFTDHKSFTYALTRVPDPWTARQARQLSYMAEYTSDIRHIAGVNTLFQPSAIISLSVTHGAAMPASAATAVKEPLGSAVATSSAGSSSTPSSPLPALAVATVKVPLGLLLPP